MTKEEFRSLKVGDRVRWTGVCGQVDGEVVETAETLVWVRWEGDKPWALVLYDADAEGDQRTMERVEVVPVLPAPQ